MKIRDLEKGPIFSRGNLFSPVLGVAFVWNGRRRRSNVPRQVWLFRDDFRWMDGGEKEVHLDEIKPSEKTKRKKIEWISSRCGAHCCFLPYRRAASVSAWLFSGWAVDAHRFFCQRTILGNFSFFPSWNKKMFLLNPLVRERFICPLTFVLLLIRITLKKMIISL